MVFPKQYLEQWDIIRALIDVLKQNFLKNFIFIVSSKLDGNILKHAEVEVIDPFLQEIDGIRFWIFFSNYCLLHADNEGQYSEILLIDELPFIGICLHFGFLWFRQKLYFIMGIKVCQAQRHRNVYLLFIALMETLNFLVFPLGNGETDVVGIVDRA